MDVDKEELINIINTALIEEPERYDDAIRKASEDIHQNFKEHNMDIPAEDIYKALVVTLMGYEIKE